MKRMALAAAGVLVLAAVLLLSFRRAPASTGAAGRGAPAAGSFWSRARAR